MARLDRADFVGPADQIGGFDRCGLNRIGRLHAPFDHLCELSRVVPVRINAGVGAESDLRSRLPRFAKIFALGAADFLFFLDRFGQHSGLRALLQYKIVIVDVEDEIRAVLLGQRDAFVIDEAAVLDGIDAGVDRVLDRLRTVRVRGDFAAEFVSFFDDRTQFFERVLRRAGLIAFAQYSAGCADLDNIGAVLHGFAHFRARGPGSVGDAFSAVMKLIGEEIVVAMSAGDSERRSGDQHARAFDQAFVDSVAHGDVGVAARADVSNRRETGVQRDASVLDAVYGFFWD